ncbi:uncharacterized protein LOC120282372 [Dioscorea cayenensis subsp. rotundata]|uniref:Uncharacterized protein LOC120282372 n=1 Tax=Dioscorea cayennensis subsp. rotundata TaxID=55577 RepID=A0AB40D4D7_DIOCR|nr:uncharacterized protein LOC120282372 [Dioscorea cayenensis subsp. rotundata]
MVKSPRGIRRPAEGYAAGSIEVGYDRLVIRLPDPRLISLVARSALLVTVMFSLPWLRAMLRNNSVDAKIGSVEDSVYLPMVVRDLNRQGLLKPGDKAVFAGGAVGRLLPLLKRNQIDLVQEGYGLGVDFVFAGNGFGESTDKALKVGGVAAFPLTADPAHPFRIPANYRMVYIRRFGSTIVGMRKISNLDPDDAKKIGARRLLTVPEAKKDVLDGLEDVLLEPPLASRKMKPGKYSYLPDLTGDSLDGYSRRVFVDVGLPSRPAKSEEWFKKRYPTKNHEFEMIRVDIVGKGAVAAAQWLESNVKEEEYVVMKAEAEVVEEMLKGKAVRLVDELFLECKNMQWRRGRRAYWECLALYGKLRDQGVAVHQWWA